MRQVLLRAAAFAGRALVLAAVSAGVAWACLALWFDGPSPRWVAGPLAAAYVLASAAALGFLRPRRRGLLAAAAGAAAVAGWWFTLEPRNDRAWQPDVARLARVTRDGDRVAIENVRDFEYRSETDFTERWVGRTYDLARLRGVDLFLCYWGPTLVAHTIASFEFEGGRHLAVSIETRKERGESYSAVRGFFRQYELCYVVAEERDVVGLRAAHRGERVFLYRLRTGPGEARALLEEYLRSIDRLAAGPRWYNALTTNCTTSIRDNLREAGVTSPFDIRILLNGGLDRLGWERGTIDTSLPFEELRARSDVTERAKAAVRAADFGARIREGLPGERR